MPIDAEPGGAVVMMENAIRHLGRQGVSRVAAIRAAAKEVARPIITGRRCGPPRRYAVP